MSELLFLEWPLYAYLKRSIEFVFITHFYFTYFEWEWIKCSWSQLELLNVAQHVTEVFFRGEMFSIYTIIDANEIRQMPNRWQHFTSVL